MKVYVIGGWVRDKLLGIPANDKDYVVVGSTIDEMLSLGFEQVGKAFPVFLHPETKEEYALARKDKKVGLGHTGFEFDFTPDITLKEDQIRRDFTISSIAFDEETNTYIDNYGGIDDLRKGILRHTSDAFVDDPLRVLRAFRLATKYKLTINEDTSKLIKQVIFSSDFKNLSEERILAELFKTLSLPNFIDFFDYMYDYKVFHTFYDDNFAETIYANVQRLKKLFIISELYKDLLLKFSKEELILSILYNGIDKKYLTRIDANIKTVILSYQRNSNLLSKIELLEHNSLYEFYWSTDYNRRPFILQYIMLYSDLLFNTIDITINLFETYKINLKNENFVDKDINFINSKRREIFNETILKIIHS